MSIVDNNIHVIYKLMNEERAKLWVYMNDIILDLCGDNVYPIYSNDYIFHNNIKSCIILTLPYTSDTTITYNSIMVINSLRYFLIYGKWEFPITNSIRINCIEVSRKKFIELSLIYLSLK